MTQTLQKLNEQDITRQIQFVNNGNKALCDSSRSFTKFCPVVELVTKSHSSSIFKEQVNFWVFVSDYSGMSTISETEPKIAEN